MTFDPFTGRFELTFVQSPILSRVTELFVPQMVHYGDDGLGYKVTHSEDLIIDGYPFGQTLKVRKRVGATWDEDGISYIRIEPTSSSLP